MNEQKLITIIMYITTAIVGFTIPSIGFTKYMENKNRKMKQQAIEETRQINADFNILDSKYPPCIIMDSHDRVYKVRQIKNDVQNDITFDCKTNEEISNIQVSKEQLANEKQYSEEYAKKHPIEIKSRTIIGDETIIITKDNNVFVAGKQKFSTQHKEQIQE